MSIRHSLLALLSGGDAYGYQLRARFEAATGSAWPLNIGQVYTTLGRLERDGLVQGQGADDEGRSRYRLTDEGQAELTRWWSVPVRRADRPRDELATKIALAVCTEGVDVAAVIQTQRRSTLANLQDLTRLKRHDGADLSWQLVLESMIFTAESEIRWLDHCEATVLRHRRQAASRAGVQAAASMPEYMEQRS